MYENIRNLREDKDILQKEMAEYLHCSQVAYSRYELGLRDIPTQVLISLAKFHNTSTDFLLGLTNAERPYPAKK
ncbi:MAG: helix-turn-helix domain-containing protein [Oscillospiraceae bacterium]|jgi:transcriptional regulator with XRE-family HTH domain|nr:helix-turn-helix domain-containing protein [Oscillospiraceae bacterium]